MPLPGSPTAMTEATTKPTKSMRSMKRLKQLKQRKATMTAPMRGSSAWRFFGSTQRAAAGSVP
jgi:hypothetical protein